MNTLPRFALLVACTACVWLRADILMLNTGVKYVGTISRSEPGKLAIVTEQGNFTFADTQVNFLKTMFTKPQNYDDAMDALKAKKYAKALPLFEAWEKRYRDLPTEWFEKALYGIAVCRANTGKKDAAVSVFEKMLALFPDSAYRSDAESWLIEHQISSSSGAELETKLKTLLADKRSTDAARARIHQLLGKYYESQKHVKEALDNYATIIVLYGDIEEFQQIAQRKCADLFAACGRTNEAAFYYQQVLENYRDELSPEDKALCGKWAKMATAPEAAKAGTMPAATKPGVTPPAAKKVAPPSGGTDSGAQKIKAKGLGADGAGSGSEESNMPVRSSDS